MITAETVNGIVRFQANGLPAVSLYCRVDPVAADLMPGQYPTAAQLRFPPPPREAGPQEAGGRQPIRTNGS